MNPSSPGDRANLVLALHSCSETFGVGLQALSQADQPAAAARMETFPAGRHLSNRLLECVETVLPARDWPRLVRLGVATGPGGFTGTRLSVVMARTLAQQLELPLDGVSGFWLMARRFWRGADGGIRPLSGWSRTCPVMGWWLGCTSRMPGRWGEWWSGRPPDSSAMGTS